MAKKRKRAQGLNWVIGGLRKIAYDDKVSGKDRLEALKLVIQIDGIIDAPGTPAPSDVDATKLVTPLVENLLNEMREGKNATT